MLLLTVEGIVDLLRHSRAADSFGGGFYYIEGVDVICESDRR